MSPPPEVLFDRFFRQVKAPINHVPGNPDRRPYKGKKDLAVLPPLIESLLTNIQQTFNEALRNEKKDIPEHVLHYPFHFDYIDSDIPNALAFIYENYSFIGITVGLINILWDTSARLSTSEEVRSVIGTQVKREHREAMHVVLFRTQVSFVIAHEYTHHVHGHVSESILSDEVRGGGDTGNLGEQILEVDADGYAAYHVLAHLFGAEGRSHAVDLLNLGTESPGIQDEVLFSCFVAAMGSYLFTRPPDELDNGTIYQLTHPPQAARMNCIMQQAINWAKQNRPALATWMSLDRFQGIMQAVANATFGINGGKTWAAQTAFLKSEPGAEYVRKLDAGFKAHVQSL